MMGKRNAAPDEITRYEQGTGRQAPPLRQVREEGQVPQSPDGIVDGERPEDSFHLTFFPDHLNVFPGGDGAPELEEGVDDVKGFQGETLSREGIVVWILSP